MMTRTLITVTMLGWILSAQTAQAMPAESLETGWSMRLLLDPFVAVASVTDAARLPAGFLDPFAGPVRLYRDQDALEWSRRPAAPSCEQVAVVEVDDGPSSSACGSSLAAAASTPMVIASR